uniref:Family with sequence similarity 8 member A1a n=1 Tax=Cyclopterus lumpus TaxID=8103 RepID=A0A8C2WMF8_CYCLU
MFERDETSPQAPATTEYCAELQQWMWQYYCWYANWQSWVALSAFPCPPPWSFPPPGTSAQTPGFLPCGNKLICLESYQTLSMLCSPDKSHRLTVAGFSVCLSFHLLHAGREYTIPSLLQRFLAEAVDFFILFSVRTTIVLWIMHLSGMKSNLTQASCLSIAKLISNFIVEEIDENTSMEDLQKMMAVALVYRVLVCVYETICIWGADGATPGKFLLGLRVVTCDTSTLVRPNRVLVVPASKVSLSASALRALNKYFSFVFLLPVFITLLFFQHNRTGHDIVAGTIVVQRRGGR